MFGGKQLYLISPIIKSTPLTHITKRNSPAFLSLKNAGL